jgi:hypothetical protein
MHWNLLLGIAQRSIFFFITVAISEEFAISAYFLIFVRSSQAFHLFVSWNDIVAESRIMFWPDITYPFGPGVVLLWAKPKTFLKRNLSQYGILIRSSE